MRGGSITGAQAAGRAGGDWLNLLAHHGHTAAGRLADASTIPTSLLLPQSFGDLGLSRPLLKACQALGYAHPTPIQVGSSRMR